MLQFAVLIRLQSMRWNATSFLSRSLIALWCKTELWHPFSGSADAGTHSASQIAADASWEDKRKALTGLFAEAMVRTGALNLGYRIWVMPSGNDQAVLLVRLYAPLTLHASSQQEVERFLATQAPAQLGIDIFDVVWLRDKQSLRRAAPVVIRQAGAVDYLLDARNGT
ncbi:hypothetical protein AAV94_03150 [Lampropedia cohaerens]|uniref:Uncharacterized protein n=1 Tax=Lampropedia cohaerens TaxID=1610491 RepID=A0A0U1Q2C1_9BURK|nr:hypothetical protein AAV94_03150 [Lampropedia cohaerens]